MTQLDALKSAKSLHEVAALLSFKPSALSFILYKKDIASKYRKFDIPKRYGGSRQICAPSDDLKLCQRRLADLLQNCVEEINEANARIDHISHGFKRGRSIITNAIEHRNRRYVFNVDLKDFFGTINFGRVRGFFIKDANFSLQPSVATVLAQIACHENALPQGSPCSPIISNLIGHVLDIHLVRLASHAGCTYSRYADDLTFSTNKKNFPASIAKHVESDEHKWIPGNEFTRLVNRSGFVTNPLKTRMQYRDSRQEVTGLIVNKKVNVRTEYRHTVRAMVHRLFTTGSFDLVGRVVDERGAVISNKTQGTTNQLRGMLSFIDGIDLHNKKHDKKGKSSKKQPDLTSKESMYQRFLLFSEFYVAATPVIICEGKTDNVYILHAIRSLVATYPLLATKDADGKIKLNVRIYKYSDTSTGRILGITGGTGDLSYFIRQYALEVMKFKAPGAQQPVIVLVDNDDGATKIYSTVKEITKKKITGNEPFIHITSNLYLVPTPLKPEAEGSTIEDFFDDSVKSIILEGKRFVGKDKFDAAMHYGKTVFAHKVVKPKASEINFNEFKALLSNIESAIDDHAKKHPVAILVTQ